MSQYLSELEFICKQIIEVYYEITMNQKLDVQDKAMYDEVTNIDFEIEKTLIDRIYHFDQNAHILSEELNSTVDRKEKTWIIDPIDGTCNLTHGIPIHGVQCALFDEEEIKLAAIYLPFSNELFTAVKGCGARLNNVPIGGAKRDINHAIVSFGDYNHSNLELFNLEKNIMYHVAQIAERVRMFGAASVDFAYAASGRIDANFTFVKNSWDIMPGLLLCKEAGLILTDAYGRPYTFDSDTIAVFSTKEIMKACTNIHKKIV